MKKLLTILTLAVALCMICGLALAATDVDSDKLLEEAYKEVARIHSEEGHELVAVERLDPKCEEKGYIIFECKSDDFVHTVVLNALGHDFVLDETAEDNVEPTCITAGKGKFVCSRCGESEIKDIEALGHLFSSDVVKDNWGEIIEPATCTKEGKAVDKCIRENHEDGEDVNGFNTKDGYRDPEYSRVIPKIPHDDLGVVYLDPDCESLKASTKVKYATYCSMCGGYTYDRKVNANETAPNWTKIKTTIEFSEFLKTRYAKTVWGKTHDENGHVWDAWGPQAIDSDKELYACEEHAEMRSCRICGQKQRRVVKENPVYDLAGDPDLQWLVNCYEQRDTWYCKICGGAVEGHKVEDTYLLAAPAHEFNEEPDEVVEATCTSTGLKTWYCIHEDEDARHDSDPTTKKTEVIPKLDHLWGDWVMISPYVEKTAAGEKHFGLYSRRCEVCGATEEQPFEGDLDGIIAATEDGPWVEVKEADMTDEQKEKVKATCVLGTGHLFVMGDKEEVRRDNDAKGHDFVLNTAKSKEATCTETGLEYYACSKCDATKEVVVKAKGHNIVKDPAKAATCTEVGYEEGGSHCTNCDKMTVKGKEIPALGHKYVKVPAVKPTCTVAGKTAGVACENCGDVVLAQDEIPATGHDMGEYVVTKAATCTEAGIETSTCKNGCGETATREIAAIGHAFGEWTVVKEASCLDKDSKGMKERVCSICSEKETEEIPAIESHKLGELVVEVEPTCTEAGKGVRTCEVCGTKVYEVIDAKNHVYGEKVVVTEATCTEVGLSTEKCTVCGFINAVEIPAKGHTEKVVPGFEATCGEAGLTDGKVCEVCGEELVAQKEIPATGDHDFNIVAGKEPTCTEAGITEGVSCKVCGKVMLAQKEIPANGHDIVELEAIAASCTEAGLTAGQYCKNCDDETVEQEVVAALGHAWDEGEITKEATPFEAGEKTFKCTRCDETKEEAVEFVPELDPVYTIEGLVYDGMSVTGKLVHDPWTKDAENLTVRVTFFLEGNYYMATIGEVDADGSFTVDGVGPIEYISLVVNGSLSVAPEEVIGLGGAEIYVK